MKGALRWILVAVLVLALVGLIRYARGKPGDDGRAPDPEHAATLVLRGAWFGDADAEA
jgi:hypothetical protein